MAFGATNQVSGEYAMLKAAALNGAAPTFAHSIAQWHGLQWRELV